MAVGKKASAPLPQSTGAIWLWMRVPPDALILDGVVVPLGEEMSAREAAKLLGVDVRSMQRKCDLGVLQEELEWRKADGKGPSGQYRIKRAAILRLLRNMPASRLRKLRVAARH